MSGQLFEEQWMELKKMSGKEEKRDDSTESKKDETFIKAYEHKLLDSETDV